MTNQWLNFGILNICFLSLFALAECLLIYKNWQVENTRKLVHIGAGMLALTFPFAFTSWLPVALTTGGFALLLAFTKRHGFLNAINGIQRTSHGSYLYPLTIMACFLFAQQLEQPLYYLMPMLLMAIGDPMACWAGQRWPIFSIRIPGGKKSLGGALGCFSSTALLAAGMLHLFPMPLEVELLTAAILLGAAATTAEGLSGYGLDNVTMPGAILLTMYLLAHSPEVLIAQLVF